MKRAWAAIKKWWWLILGGLLAVAAFIFFGARKRKLMTKEELLTGKDTGNAVESLRQVAVIEAEKAQTDILIEKAKADTKVEVKRQELERIEKEPDPVVRRRRLARWAEQNI